MKNINIKARIKRNRLDELAGEFYRDETSFIVKELNDKNRKALLGIQSDDGKYTILGEESVYYRTSSGFEGEIPYAMFLKILTENAWSLGKTGDFEVVKISEKDSIWVLNAATMTAMWNTILLLDGNVR